MPGPLDGLRVVEMAAIGPVPFCGMLLGDMGADVIRIDRAESASALQGTITDVCGRGKRSVAIDLKSPVGLDLGIRLAVSADVLLEGFRPGVAERLGIGPEDIAKIHPSLVYGRMTGWGQDGPMAAMAGHDINYIGLTGALHAIGSVDGPPVIPLNLVGDYGGGALYLALGVLAALFERASGGRGQIVDAAMVDGAASLMAPTYQLKAAGLWTDARGVNLLDGGAPFYGTYATSDAQHMAVGALEPQFYAELVSLLGLEASDLPPQLDREGWPVISEFFRSRFGAHPRRHWESVFAGSDACVTPVLTLDEAPRHAHNQARNTFIGSPDNPQPAPAPRFSRTPGRAAQATPAVGAHTAQVLAELGLSLETVSALAEEGVVALANGGAG